MDFIKIILRYFFEIEILSKLFFLISSTFKFKLNVFGFAMFIAIISLIGKLNTSFGFKKLEV